MRILAVETSGPRGGIALAEGKRLIEQVPLGEGIRHGRDLLVALRAACRRARWTPNDVNLVAVSIGPGSFTGLRIAVVFAKIVAWDTGALIVAVPSLRALAENAPPEAQRIVPILDAKRGGLYAGIYLRAAESRRGDEPRETDLLETLPPTLIESEDLAKRLKGRNASSGDRAAAFILGRGIPKARDALGAFDLAPEDLWDVRPGVVARLGLKMHERGEHADPLRLEPLYIRRPEAEEIWRRRKRKL